MGTRGPATSPDPLNLKNLYFWHPGASWGLRTRPGRSVPIFSRSSVPRLLKALTYPHWNQHFCNVITFIYFLPSKINKNPKIMESTCRWLYHIESVEYQPISSHIDPVVNNWYNKPVRDQVLGSTLPLTFKSPPRISGPGGTYISEDPRSRGDPYKRGSGVQGGPI